MIRIERLPADSTLAEGSKAFRSCREIRRRVFVEEQSVPPELEWDGLDGEARHFIAYDEDGSPVGTARMRLVGPAAKAERVAVLASARGRDGGRALMQAIESAARDEGKQLMRLNAQVAVVPFYEKLGYRPEGDVFVEAGIEHRAMHKVIG